MKERSRTNHDSKTGCWEHFSMMIRNDALRWMKHYFTFLSGMQLMEGLCNLLELLSLIFLTVSGFTGLL